ncbi:serine/threonine-protein kinase [Crateriforma conspicua]|uniref:non-specific serine/threonine protein kinase n=1 Tax=Crateriforma conspicua TaxID=2527996 RepID=A0A5C5Y4D9_9PLAN|nr:serine/threonine-protein kinase [Crateriforma conspicua]QDV64111.1 Serine/threonine-protein kinase PK-1 [Crateriforma conspicua]TWT69501.1 Serine/threonine-protein kinase PK-1 [Crateriforma conspicua]
MSDLTAEDFAMRVIDHGLAERREVNQAISDLGVGELTLDDAVSALQKRGLVTTLQTEKIMRGDRSGYFFGDYKVLYLIGAGTFARVYRAEKDDQVFAVKVLRKRFRDEVKELEQFLREGNMGLKLRHPNIVRIFDVVPDKRNPFLVMEFVEGQTLRDLVRIRGKLPPELALRLMYEISSGLDYAASLGISHRDLKLSNVLTTADGKAKLVDFGLAALSDRNNPEEIADCPNARAIDYAALERGTGVRKDDPRSDIFFAGNMLYHMLAGRPALTETRDRLARLNVSRFQEITPLHDLVPDIPGVVNHLVQRAMTFRPDKRIQSARQLMEESKRAMEQLAAGDRRRVDEYSVASDTPDDDETGPSNEGEGYVVMLVESKIALQNAVRERLKSKGYRVLVISDPNRALGRFVEGEDKPADCVIFGAAELGSLAVEAYNRFATDEHTCEIPSILLADRRQEQIIRQARRGPNRKLLALPLKVRELRAALVKLLASVPRREMGY